MAFVELIPSSARSTSSHALPLPQHLRPLLQPALDTVTTTLEKTLPAAKKRDALEEAEWEYDDADGGWERELISQCEYIVIEFGPVLRIV